MGSPLRGFLSVTALLLASGCGTSSSTSVNAPSARCEVRATAQPAAVGAPGGTGSIIVTTDRECAWEARSEAEWLLLSGATGRGDGTLGYTAAGNTIVTERRGAVVVNGVRLEIGQAAAACRFTLDRAGHTVAAAGGRHDVSVGAQAGCAWTARSDVPWIAVAAGAAGSGAGLVSIAVAPNTSPESRAATITVAGQPYAIEQAGAAPGPGPTPTPPAPGCQFSVSPRTAALGAEGGALEVSVTASSPACSWTAVSTVPWIVMEGGVGETGTGRRRFVVAPNPSTAGRSGALELAGVSVIVTQAAAAAPPPPAPPPPAPPPPAPPPPTCTFAVSPNPVSVGFAGQSDIDLHVVTASGCAWTAASQAGWIAIKGASSGTGDSHLRIAVEPTLQVNGRTGTLTVGGQTVTVNQAGILNQDVTIRGTVRSLSGACPVRTFTINGTTIVTDDRTEYPGRDDCHDLESGEHARVRGVGQSDGTIRATVVDEIGDGLLGVSPVGDRP